jgi:anti-anti-sigma regulatory factor
MAATSKQPLVRVVGLGSHYHSFDPNELSRITCLFRKLAERNESPALVLDFSKTETFSQVFCDLIVDLRRRLERNGARLLLGAVRDDLAEMLVLAGVPVDRIFATREAAVSAGWRAGRAIVRKHRDD